MDPRLVEASIPTLGRAIASFCSDQARETFATLIASRPQVRSLAYGAKYSEDLQVHVDGHSLLFVLERSIDSRISHT